MSSLPRTLFRGVASMSRHHLEAQNLGTCTPRGGDAGHGLSIAHSRGRTEDSNSTSWTSTRSVAQGYARSSPRGLGVVLEIDFAGKVAATNYYRQMGDRFGEDEWLIQGVIRGVRVTRV